MRKGSSIFGSFLAASLFLSSSLSAQVTTPAEAQAIAKEAYIYGMPMAAEYNVIYLYSVDRENPQYKGPFNSILNIGRILTPDDTAFVTPNADTPSTFLGLDLRAEPVVINIPPVDGNRYWAFQMMDLYTFNFDYLGTRATGNNGGIYLVAGPGWNGDAPPNISKVIHAETDFISIVGRTQLYNSADLDTVKAIQSKYKVQTLSDFLAKPAPPALPPVNWFKPIPPAQLYTNLEFFNELNFLLQACPTPPSETALRDRFASIGVAPGKTINFADLSPEMKSALLEGMADGQKAIDERRAATHGDSNSLFGTRAYLKNDYLARAIGAQMNIGANSKEEAIYSILERDSSGQPFNGSSGRYTLRFAPEVFPPVHAFWSVTMYNLPQQLLVRNPLDRYLINSPMLPQLKRDLDGGVTIYIQADSPGKDKQSNWLPAPKGPFMLTLRYYLPNYQLLDGSWKSPPVSRIN